MINAKLNFCYSREIPGTLTKGKYRSSNEFTSGYDIQDMSGGFESNSEVPSWTMGDEDNELELSTTAEEYFSSVNIVESILNDVIDKALQSGELSDSSKVCIPKNFFLNHILNIEILSEFLFFQSDDSIRLDTEIKRNGVGVHNLHSHMLLYCGVYDSTRTLYSLSTLRNEIQTNARIFLCSAATTGVTSSVKSNVLLNLLGRHRKSVFGRNFHGEIASTEFISMYRSSMYLEVLISICLYFARSYYPNLGQMRLTQEEISGNRQVRKNAHFRIEIYGCGVLNCYFLYRYN